MTVIDTPFGPCVCERAIVGVVMVNVVVAVSTPLSLPVATTAYDPAAIEGTVKVQVKVPVADVVCEVHVWVPGVAPLKVKVLMGVEAEKPDPCTVTLLATPCGD